MNASGDFFVKTVGGIVLGVGCGCAGNAMYILAKGFLSIQLSGGQILGTCLPSGRFKANPVSGKLNTEYLRSI